MTKKDIASGVVHKLPVDLRKALTADKAAMALWEDITPLARNEWICWIEDAKKAETRNRRITVGLDKMRKGMLARRSLGRGGRRPCCWAGCPHR